MRMSTLIKALKSPRYFCWLTLRFISDNFFKFSFPEKKMTYGTEHSDKIFYVIGLDCKCCGIIQIIILILKHIEYAKKHNYISVVDLKNFHNQYLDDSAFGKENAWEYFLKQPENYSLDDIKKAKNVIHSRNMPRLSYDTDFDYPDLFNKEKMSHFKKLFSEKIKFNDDTRNYIENKYNSIIKDKKDILGVICRGTDLVIKKIQQHPIQPTAEQVIEKSEEIMNKYNCSYIFLATEDNDIFNTFREKFYDKLLFVEQKRFSKKEFEKANAISQIEKYTKSDKYKVALDYLSSIYILSKCKCFISGINGGAQGVYFMSNGFEYDYLWELGYHPNSIKQDFFEIYNSIVRKRNAMCEL